MGPIWDPSGQPQKGYPIWDPYEAQLHSPYGSHTDGPYGTHIFWDVPRSPSYGVLCISQHIRFARVCFNVDGVNNRNKILTFKLRRVSPRGGDTLIFFYVGSGHFWGGSKF